jgi:uncharacterized OsmC-like protein
VVTLADPSAVVELRQEEEFRYEARYPGAAFGPVIVDEPAPTGGGTGPSPTQILATAVGHCMSSTLYDCFRRAHVPVRGIVTTVRTHTQRNDRGRLRVRRIEVDLRCEPVRPEDRERVDRCLEVFADYCPVSGAVRDGVTIEFTSMISTPPAP